MKSPRSFRTTGSSLAALAMFPALSGAALDNGLHHLVATYDGTNLTYYLDGSTDMGGFNSGHGYSATINVTGLNLSSLDVIGRSGGAPWPDHSFSGDLLDFRIFDNAMTASQVADLGALGADATNARIVAAVPEPAAGTLYGT